MRIAVLRAILLDHYRCRSCFRRFFRFGWQLPAL
jgi:hypothetical protein